MKINQPRLLFKVRTSPRLLGSGRTPGEKLRSFFSVEKKLTPIFLSPPDPSPNLKKKPEPASRCDFFSLYFHVHLFVHRFIFSRRPVGTDCRRWTCLWRINTVWWRAGISGECRLGESNKRRFGVPRFWRSHHNCIFDKLFSYSHLNTICNNHYVWMKYEVLVFLSCKSDLLRLYFVYIRFISFAFFYCISFLPLALHNSVFFCTEFSV